MKRACNNKILVRKCELKKSLETPRYGWKDNTSKDVTETGCEGMDTAMNFGFYRRQGIYS
jgi:hypothetical protein